MCRRPQLVLVTLVMAGSWQLAADAQQARYVPPMGGTPPSALNLFRFDSRSPRDYDGFALRTQELGQQTRQLGTQFESLSVRQKSDQRAIEKLERSLLQLRAPSVAPTGVEGHYRDYSHYYPQYPASRGVRAIRR
jgi:hypothetical protein